MSKSRVAEPYVRERLYIKGYLSDLEKILGFPVRIQIRGYHHKVEMIDAPDLTNSNLYFVKDDSSPTFFTVNRVTPTEKDPWSESDERYAAYVARYHEPYRDPLYASGKPYKKWMSERLYVSRWRLQQMPGCCGILISTAAHVNKDYRGKGVASLLNTFRREIAYNLGYTTLLCTDVQSNSPQKKVLEKNGWKDIYQFKNQRTGNDVNISVVNTGKSVVFTRS